VGYKVTTPVWDNSKAKGGDLLVLVAIADSADNETGVAFPSIKYLAEKSRLTERAVQYAITRLKNMGELEVLQNTGKVNTFRVTLFTPNLSPNEEKKLIAQAEESAKQRQGGAKIAPPKPVNNSRQGGAKIAPLGVQPTSPGGANGDIHYKVLEPVIEPVPLSPGERDRVAMELTRLYPNIIGLPDSVSSEKALLFLHKTRTGELRKENIYSPVAYMAKMHGEDITALLLKYRENWLRMVKAG